MKLFGRRTVIAAVAAVFGLGILGTAAFAAIAPAPDTFSLVPALPGAPVADTKNGGDKLKALLDALVAKNVITQQQEDAILAAAKDARGDKQQSEFLRKVFASLFEQSATYLGMQPADLKTKLPGTSLAAIANGTAGKSRDALVAYLTNAANDAIAKALAAGTISQAQADKAKADAPAHIANFVDHTYPKAQPRAFAPNIKMFVADGEKAASDYLGVAPKDLATQLRSGKSLGEIADATAGKSRAGLVATLTNLANTKIDQAAKDGKLTADQATQLKSKVADAVTQLVDHKATARPTVKSR